MIQSHDDQQMEKRNQKLNEKFMDKKNFDENLIPQLHAYRQDQFNIERLRIENVKKYKEELDKQVNENKKIKFGTSYIN
jgi:thymidylate synthase